MGSFLCGGEREGGKDKEKKSRNPQLFKSKDLFSENEGIERKMSQHISGYGKPFQGWGGVSWGWGGPSPSPIGQGEARVRREAGPWPLVSSHPPSTSFLVGGERMQTAPWGMLE